MKKKIRYNMLLNHVYWNLYTCACTLLFTVKEHIFNRTYFSIQSSAGIELIIGEAAKPEDLSEKREDLLEEREDDDNDDTHQRIVTVDCEQAEVVQNEILTRLKHIEDILESYVVPQYSTMAQYRSSSQLQYTGSTPYSSSSSENVNTPHQSSPPALQIPNDMDTLLSAIDIQSITGFGTNPGAMGFTSSDPTQIEQDTVSLNAGTNRPSQLIDAFSPAELPMSDSATNVSDASISELPSDSQLYLKLGLSPNLVKVINGDANSGQNLAAKLIKKVFSKERDTCNVHGRKGKKRLDSNKMSLVRRLTYQIKPLKPGEKEEENWRKNALLPSTLLIAKKKTDLLCIYIYIYHPASS